MTAATDPALAAASLAPVALPAPGGSSNVPAAFRSEAAWPPQFSADQNSLLRVLQHVRIQVSVPALDSFELPCTPAASVTSAQDGRPNANSSDAAESADVIIVSETAQAEPSAFVRSFPRFPSRGQAIVILRLPTGNGQTRLSKRLCGAIRDISQGGLALELGEELPAGTEFLVRLFHTRDEFSVDAAAVALRSERRGTYFRVACKFSQRMSLENVSQLSENVPLSRG